MKRFKPLLIIALLLVCPLISRSVAGCTGGIPVWTCPANATDIANAISSGAKGDTINVAAGTIAALNVTVDGRYLIGAGTATYPPTASSGTVIQSGTINVVKDTTYHSTLAGFSFTNGAVTQLAVTGTAAAKAFIAHHNYFYTDGTGASHMITIGVNGGLFHHDTFYSPIVTGADIFNTAVLNADGDWTIAHTMGSADTTGEKNLYFEDSNMTNIATMPDADTGTRLVVRHNVYTDGGVIDHSATPNDTGFANNGHRHTEVYENYFHRVDPNQPVNWWLWLRGGTGVFANNHLDPAAFGAYGGKDDVHMTVGCSAADGPPDGMTPSHGTPLAYPVTYQVGQSTTPAENPPSHPFLIFGNTQIDGTTPYSPVVGLLAGPVVGCPGVNGDDADAATYVQLGRDYKTTNAWSSPWVAYTYPHPLQGSACTPDHLSFIAQPVSANLAASIGVVTVGVYDSGSVLCTAATNSVSVAKNGSATWGTLSGTTPVSAINGIATFSDLAVITTAGAGSIDVSSSGLTGATSSSITISVPVVTVPLSIKLLLRLRGH